MTRREILLILMVGLLATASGLAAQDQGPKKEVGETVAKPHKKDANTLDSDLPIPSKLSNKKKTELPLDTPGFKVDTSLVNVDVAVLDNKGRFIPKIPKANFRILEDNVPQQISNFSMGEAPVTVCMVIEFSNRFQQYFTSTWQQTLQASYGFLETLKPEDYVAIVAYDLRPTILSDFSTDKRKAYEAMQRLRIAGFSESNLYDALVDTEGRMSGIEGRKAIVLISSGVDTFSKLTFDKARKALDFLQADNQMRTFAKETGGMSFFPRFYGEFPSIYQAIQQALRNQYSIAYSPTNQAHDGKFRKVKVELVNPATNEPLRVVDEKGKPIKYSILAKAGYTAPHEVE